MSVGIEQPLAGTEQVGGATSDDALSGARTAAVRHSLGGRGLASSRGAFDEVAA